jgi:putative flippase GtrA
MITYVIVGGMTTVVYFATYAVFKYLGVHYEINTCIAWTAAVLFAFFTNKYIVFRSMEKEHIWAEMLKFFGARFTTLGVDLLFTFLLIGVASINEWISKILVQFIILVLNFVFSKWFVFTKKKSPEEQ